MTPDKLYALQLAFKECGLMLTAEQVRRVLDHARDVVGVAATPVVESGAVWADHVAKCSGPDIAIPAFLTTAKAGDFPQPFDKPALGANETDPRWPAYGPGPGGQTDREGKA
ncbi:MAG: hypothetical protein ACK4RV_10300 [Caulobacter sp.]